MSKDLYFGGIPTEPDLKKIKEHYPDSSLQKGQIIFYEDIERILGVAKNTNRFRAVTNTWRKQVNEAIGQRIGTEKGVGFKILTEPEKVNVSESKLRTAVKMARDSFIRSSEVDVTELTEEQKYTVENVHQKSGKLIATAQIKSNQTTASLKE